MARVTSSSASKRGCRSCLFWRNYVRQDWHQGVWNFKCMNMKGCNCNPRAWSPADVRDDAGQNAVCQIRLKECLWFAGFGALGPTTERNNGRYQAAVLCDKELRAQDKADNIVQETELQYKERMRRNSSSEWEALSRTIRLRAPVCFLQPQECIWVFTCPFHIHSSILFVTAFDSNDIRFQAK